MELDLSSVLQGSGALIDAFLDCPAVGRPPHYRHKEAMLRLCAQNPVHPSGRSLLARLADLVGRNCEAASGRYTPKPSKQNWRFTSRTVIGSQNLSPEVTLERAIVRSMGTTFANQVPTASGLAGPNVDKTRNIDLVRRTTDNSYEFIELKVSSNTPLLAAFEIYGYAAIYTYYRAMVGPRKDDAEGRPILKASRIGLRSLAPQKYYRGLELRWLEELLNTDLALYRFEQSGLSVFSDFAFLTFPEGFHWGSGAETREWDITVSDAVAGIGRLYG